MGTKLEKMRGMMNGSDVKIGKLGEVGYMQRLSRALAAALLLPITVVCTALTIYFGNASELGIDLPSVLKIASVFLVLAALVLFICQLPFVFLFKGKCFVFVNAFLVMAGCWFWMQANVFNWTMGIPDFGGINFADFIQESVLEFCVWLCGAICTLLFFRSINRFAIQISTIVVATQLVALSSSSAFFKEVHGSSQALKPNFSQFESTFSGLFDYSEKTDVYLIILDALGRTVFDDIAKEEPYHTTFKDFTYFQNHFTPPPAATQWSIPRILTGTEEFREGIVDFLDTPECRKYFAEAYLTSTIFDDLTNHGYECCVQTCAPRTIYWKSESVQNIRPISRATIGLSQIISSDTFARTSRLIGFTLFRLSPVGLKKCFFNTAGVFQFGYKIFDSTEDSFMSMQFSLNDIEFFSKAKNVQWKSSNNPQLKYIHLQGNHYPYYMDENTKSLENVIRNYGIDNLQERRKIECNQARGTIKIVQWLLMEMKKRDTYDNSLIIVMSDHGAYMLEDIVLDKAAKNKPLLLVKRPGDNHDTLQTNDNPTCVSDTKNAILTELNLPRPDDAFSWFDVPKELAEKRNAEWSAYLEKRAQKH